MKKLLTIFLFVTSVTLYAQQFEQVTIMDIQFLEDSVIALGDVPSPMLGDTVVIEGIALASTVADPQNDRRPILWAGGRWLTYIQDTSGQVWGGINVIQHDTTGTNQNTFFDLVDSAQVIRVTGIVDEYFTTTQFTVLLDPIQQVLVTGVSNKRPDPIQLSITDFMTDGQLILQSEKYEGMYVEIRNVFTSDRNTGNGTFRINDENGNYMFMYDQSGYFTLRGHRLTGRTDYEPPVDGATLEYIRGVINTRTDGYYIVPLYPGDIKLGSTPPTISSIERDLVTIAPSQDVTISARIVDLDGSVSSASLIYRVNDGGYTEVPMTPSGSNDTLYTAVIPGINQDSAFVDYFIKAVDNLNQVSLSPVDTANNRYFFFVLNRDLTIQDVQYSPFGSGISAYNAYEVTVSGIVTADTSDFGNMVYVQNGSGPWSGIRVFGTDADNVKKGDHVTVTGIVNESFGVTRLGSLDQGAAVVVNSSGNPVPEPSVVNTGTVDLNPGGVVDAEQWESVLIRYENVTVSNYNADGNNNFGEMLVDDGTGEARVELEDGNHSFGNGSVPSLIVINTGDQFTSLTGILHYSYGNFKLNPRNDGDFAGYISDVKDETIPNKFEISQNYPNPFNPTTKIQFSIPNSEHVVIKVYDILGRQVAELMNNTVHAGTYTLTFNAANLSSGIYVYKIQAGDFVATKKMILMK